MIDSFRNHPFTRAVCLETARLFERRAAEGLVEAQCRADDDALGEAQRFQAKARLAQQRARAWHLRAKHAPDALIVDEGRNFPATFRMTLKAVDPLSPKTPVDRQHDPNQRTSRAPGLL